MRADFLTFLSCRKCLRLQVLGRANIEADARKVRALASQR